MNVFKSTKGISNAVVMVVILLVFVLIYLAYLGAKDQKQEADTGTLQETVADDTAISDSKPLI